MGTLFVAVILLILDASPEQIFLVAGILFAIFATPIFLVVREAPTGPTRLGAGDVLASLDQLRITIGHARAVPGLGGSSWAASSTATP